MKKSKKNFNDDIISLFEKWLPVNRERFIHKPIIMKKSKDGISIKYEGIIPEIEAYVNSGGMLVEAMFPDDTNWDMLRDIDIGIDITDSGEYFCTWCINEHQKLYATIEDLVYEHLFEDFLDWSNKKVLATKYLMLCSVGHGTTWAKIIDKDDNINLKNVVAFFSMDESYRKWE